MFELNIYCSLKCIKFVTEYLLLVTILDFILLHRDLITPEKLSHPEVFTFLELSQYF